MVCDTSKHKCVECTVNNDCSGTTSVCYDNKCVECTDDAHCNGKPENKNVCDTTAHICVQCTTERGCDNGETCVEGECLTPNPCALCEAEKCYQNACVECTKDDHCDHSANGMVCDTTEHKCVECTESEKDHCAVPNAVPLCTLENRCSFKCNDGYVQNSSGHGCDKVNSCKNHNESCNGFTNPNYSCNYICMDGKIYVCNDSEWEEKDLYNSLYLNLLIYYVNETQDKIYFRDCHSDEPAMICNYIDQFEENFSETLNAYLSGSIKSLVLTCDEYPPEEDDFYKKSYFIHEQSDKNGNHIYCHIIMRDNNRFLLQRGNA